MRELDINVVFNDSAFQEALIKVKDKMHKMNHSAQGNLILKLAQLKIVESELASMALHVDGMRQTLSNNDVIGNLNDHFEAEVNLLRTLARWTRKEYESQLAEVMFEIDEDFDRLNTELKRLSKELKLAKDRNRDNDTET